MHSGIGSSGSVYGHLFLDNLAKNPFQLFLDGRSISLTLKTEIVSAVILNDDLDIAH
jgi:hypothetical protein